VSELAQWHAQLDEGSQWDFSDLNAMFINCTLKRSPEVSDTQALGDISIGIMERNLARMLKDAGGLPAHGNQRTQWDAGCRFDYPNPEHR